jgi:hypothetical protein
MLHDVNHMRLTLLHWTKNCIEVVQLGIVKKPVLESELRSIYKSQVNHLKPIFLLVNNYLAYMSFDSMEKSMQNA